jgi:hypothetical protein
LSASDRRPASVIATQITVITPRADAYRPRLDRSQPIARKPVQQRFRETMGQHVRHGPAMRRVGK